MTKVTQLKWPRWSEIYIYLIQKDIYFLIKMFTDSYMLQLTEPQMPSYETLLRQRQRGSFVLDLRFV